MDTSLYGPAIFSTHLGRYAARNTLPPSIILRSSPDDDQDEMVAKLQRMFPLQCRAITAPITNIYDYFDPYDTHRHGYRFLESVLGTIAAHNFRRAQRVQSFVQQWKRDNQDLYDGILSRTQDVFTDAEVNEYGCEFLGEAFSLLQSLRMNQRAAPRPNQTKTSIRTSHAYHSATPAPASAHRFGASPGRQKSRGSTTLSHTHAHATSQQSRSSQKVLSPNANTRQVSNQRSKYESLQQPGGILFPARRDFHSDPEDYARHVQKHIAGPIIAIPSPGQSGPFSYQHPPLNHRVIPWPSIPSNPVTVQNPIKTVSDDARVLEMQEAVGRWVLNGPTNLGTSLHKQPGMVSHARFPDSHLQNSALPGSTASSFRQQAASYPLDKDPAVISVGFKTYHAPDQGHYSTDSRKRLHSEYDRYLTGVTNVHRSSEQQTCMEIPSEMAEKDSLPESHVGANTHRSYPESNKVNSHVVAASPTSLPHGEDGMHVPTQSFDHEPKPFRHDMTSNTQDCSTMKSNPGTANGGIPNSSQPSFQGTHHEIKPPCSHFSGNYTVWVGGLNPETTPAEITQIFESYGEISRISKVFTREHEGTKAFAFVTFLTADAAEKAISGLHFVKHGDARLKVRYAIQVKPQPAAVFCKDRDTVHRPATGTGIETPQQRNTIAFKENLSFTETGMNPLHGSKRKESHIVSPSRRAKNLWKSGGQDGAASGTSNSGSGSNFHQSRKLSFPELESGNIPTDPPEISENTEKFSNTIQKINLEMSEGPQSSEPEQSGTILAVPDSSFKGHSQKLTASMFRNHGISAKVAQMNQDSIVSTCLPVALDTSVLQSFSNAQSPTCVKGRTIGKITKSLRRLSRGRESPGKNRQVDYRAMAHGADLSTRISEGSITREMKNDAKSLTRPNQSHSCPNEAKTSLAVLANDKPLIPGDMTVSSDTSLVMHADSLKNNPLETRPKDLAEHEMKSETNLHLRTSSIGKPKPSYLILTAAPVPTADPSRTDSIALPACQPDVVVAPSSVAQRPKSSEAPEMSPANVDETSSMEMPNGRQRLEIYGPETPWTTIVTHKKKQKNLAPVKINVETTCNTSHSGGPPSKPEANPSKTQNATIHEVLFDRIDENCVTHSMGSGASSPDRMEDNEDLGSVSETTGPFHAELDPHIQDSIPETSAGTKTNRKRIRKAKGKAKPKSAKRSLRTPVVPSIEARGTSASYVRSLPEPETPFLVDNADNMPPANIAGQGNDHHGTSSINQERPPTYSRKELSQYQNLKDRDYWPQIIKVMQGAGGFTVPDPAASTVPASEECQDSGRSNVSYSQSPAPCVTKLPVRENIGFEFNHPDSHNLACDRVRPESVTRAEKFLQTCAQLCPPWVSEVAPPKSCEIGKDQIPLAGAAEEAVPDVRVLPSISNLFGDSLFGQPSSGSGSHETVDVPLKEFHSGGITSPKRWASLSKSSYSSILANPGDDCTKADGRTGQITAENLKASSESTETLKGDSPRGGRSVQDPLESSCHSKSSTPPRTPQTLYTPTCTNSSSSQGTLSDDESSESSNAQSGNEQVANETNYIRPSPPRTPIYTLYPCHPPAAPPSQTLDLPQLQYGDVVEVAPTGNREIMTVTRDDKILRITDKDGEEREPVERRDTAVVIEEETWGLPEKVWIN